MTAIDSSDRTPLLAPSRRLVVGAGMWAVPAVALATSTPAFAAASDTSVLVVSTAEGKIPATGATALTVSVRDSTGQPRAGAPVSLTAPTNAVLGASDGVTASDGTFTTTLDLRRPGAKPGSTVTVTALSGSDSATATLTVLGANVLGWGSNSGGQAGVGPGATSARLTAPTPLAPAFPSPVVAITSDGGETALALLEDGTVWTVGADRFGVRGPGVNGGRIWTQFPQLSDVVQLVAGGGVAFALKRDNSLWSWGTAEKGVRGDGSYAASSGTSADSTVATKILDGIVQVASGNDVAFALTSTGKVMGWGNNAVGAVGDGTTTDRTRPVEVSGLTAGVLQIAAQYNGGYALKSDGTVWAWGRNDFGQIGNGTSSTTGQLTPTQVSLPRAASAVTSLGDGGMALLSDRSVWSWGRNDNGQLGDGSGGSWNPIDKRRQLSPVAVSGMTDVKQLAAMSSGGLVLKNDGTVWAWGSNNNGQLGNGTTTMSTTPVQVQGLAGYAVGALCPVHGGGQAQNPYVLTVDATVSVDAPAQVSAGTAGDVAAKVAAGSTAIVGAQVVLAADNNAVLGMTTATTGSDGFVRTTVTPDAQTWPGTVVRIDATTASDAASDIVTVLGANAVAWGSNSGGQAGVGAQVTGPRLLQPSPVAPAFPAPVASLTSNGAETALALLEDGTVWTVGSDRFGVRGPGVSGSRTWQQFPQLSDVVQLVAGGGVAFARKRDKTLWSWGTAEKGVRGDGIYAATSGTSADSTVATKILDNVIDVASGNAVAYALLSDGTVRAWGDNSLGGVGDGTTTDRSTPTVVSGLSQVTQIAAQYGGGYALTSDGSVWAWGRNEFGQCGNGVSSATGQLTPVKVPLPRAATQVTGLGDAGVALLTDLTLRSWGRNDNGQLGDGTGGAWDPIEKRRQLSPVVVKDLSDVRQLAGMSSGGLALKNDGTVWTWGPNSNGQIGDGTTTTRTSPVQVQGLSGYAVGRLCPANGGGQAQNPFVVLTRSTVSVQVADSVAAGGTAGSVVAKVSSGSKSLPNAPVSLSSSSFASVANTSGQTDATGAFNTTVSVPDVWTPPGSIGRVTAGSGSSQAFDTFTVLGANVLGWGSNTQGQAGNGDAPSSVLIADQAARAFPSSVVTMTSNGAESAFALLADGTVWTIGADRFHVRGPNVAGSRSWLRFGQLTDVVQLVASGGAVFARKQDKSLWSWGVAEKGVRGDGVYASGGYTSADSGTATKILDDVIDVAAGNAVAFALLSNGTVKGWGDNYQGGVGDGTTTDRSRPVDVLNLTNIVQIAAQYNGGYALDTTGRVWAWGRNEFGQCGNGTASSAGQPTPVQVTLPMRATQVAGAGDAGYALLSDGSVRAWGRNDYGQLGDGSGGQSNPISTQTTPVAVTGMTNVKQVSSMSSGGFALKNDGSVWAWGSNESGQLGDNSTTTRLSPVQVQGLQGRTIVKLSPQNGGGQPRNPFVITSV